jgi:hypothetical protein
VYESPGVQPAFLDQEQAKSTLLEHFPDFFGFSSGHSEQNLARIRFALSDIFWVRESKSERPFSVPRPARRPDVRQGWRQFTLIHSALESN